MYEYNAKTQKRKVLSYETKKRKRDRTEYAHSPVRLLQCNKSWNFVKFRPKKLGIL